MFPLPSDLRARFYLIVVFLSPLTILSDCISFRSLEYNFFKGKDHYRGVPRSNDRSTVQCSISIIILRRAFPISRRENGQ